MKLFPGMAPFRVSIAELDDSFFGVHTFILKAKQKTQSAFQNADWVPILYIIQPLLI